jgi:hypothetical protein
MGSKKTQKEHNSEAHPIGGVGGALAEAIHPTFEDDYWRETYASRNYVREGEDYETFAPAFRYGWESYARYPRKRFEERAREAARDAWRRIERTLVERDRTAS